MLFFLLIYCLLFFLKITIASFCGKNALPSSIQVTATNYFVLGCSQPICLNWPKTLLSDDQFHDNRNSFYNAGLNSTSHTGVLELAICENSYESRKCVGDGEWVGGIKSIANNSDDLNVLCCKHEAMKAAKFLDIYDIEIGQMVRGGEVKDNDKIVAFDYISNIVKLITDKSIVYKVFVNRLPCKSSMPSLKAVKLHPVKLKSHLKFNTARLFQAPLLAVDSGGSTDHSVALDACEDDGTSAVDFDACQAEVTSSAEDFEEEFGEENTVQNRGRRSHRINTNSMVMRIIQTKRLFQASLLTVDNSDDDVDGSGQNPDTPENPLDPANQTPQPPNRPPPNTPERPSDTSVSFSDCDEKNNFFDFDDCDRFEEVDSDDEIVARVPVPPLQQPQLFQPLLPQNPPNPFQAPFQNNFDASLINPPPRDPSVFRVPEIITVPPPTPPPPMTMQCFSGDTIVKIFDYQERRLDEISTDDWILSAGNNRIGFSKVVSWLHKMPKISAKFLKFTLENGKTLKITQKHFIYKTECLAQPITNRTIHRFSYEKTQAENIQLSDCLLSLTHDTKFVPTRISKIETVQESGIYAPLTDNGNIIVNSIFASCYSEIDDELLQFTLPVVNRYFNTLVDILRIFYDIVFQNNSETDLIPGIQNFVQIVKTLL